MIDISHRHMTVMLTAAQCSSGNDALQREGKTHSLDRAGLGRQHSGLMAMLGQACSADSHNVREKLCM